MYKMVVIPQSLKSGLKFNLDCFIFNSVLVA